MFGQIAVTQAFLPLIREARGRIVNMGSIGSHITMPFGGALCATKSAFRALNDALRLELHPFGVHVAMVEPASIRTPAVDKTLGDAEGAVRQLPPEGAARYAGMLRDFIRRSHEREQHGSPPEVVAQAVHHALTAARPAHTIRSRQERDAAPRDAVAVARQPARPRALSTVSPPRARLI